MKSSAKKLLSLLLTLVMLSSLAVSAFAETKTFENYLMIGDSIAIYHDEPTVADKDKVHYVQTTDPYRAFPGTYSDFLKTELGIKNICSCGYAGWRVQEALLALGGTDYTADYMFNYGGDSVKRISTMSPIYISALENADLISINLGSNNLIQAFVYALYTAFEVDGTAFEGSEYDVQVLEYINELKADSSDAEALANLLLALEYTQRGTVLLKNALKMMPQAIVEFEKSINELFSIIYEKNPDADVLVIGVYNPIAELINHTIESNITLSENGKTLTSATATLLEQTVEPYVSAMNLYLRSGCSYSSKYVYVDVTGVDLTGSGDGVHLGTVGHQYYCSQLKAAIDTHFVTDAVPATKTYSPLSKLFSLFKK